MHPPSCRYLPNDGLTADALKLLLGGALGEVFRNVFDGDVDAPVVELSSLISGAQQAGRPTAHGTHAHAQHACHTA